MTMRPAAAQLRLLCLLWSCAAVAASPVSELRKVLGRRFLSEDDAEESWEDEEEKEHMMKWTVVICVRAPSPPCPALPRR